MPSKRIERLCRQARHKSDGFPVAQSFEEPACSSKAKTAGARRGHRNVDIEQKRKGLCLSASDLALAEETMAYIAMLLISGSQATDKIKRCSKRSAGGGARERCAVRSPTPKRGAGTIGDVNGWGWGKER